MYKEHEKNRIKTIWLDLLSRGSINKFSLCNDNAKTAVYSVTAQIKITTAIKRLENFDAESIAKDAISHAKIPRIGQRYAEHGVVSPEEWSELKYAFIRAFDKLAFAELMLHIITDQEVHDALTNHEKGN